MKQGTLYYYYLYHYYLFYYYFYCYFYYSCYSYKLKTIRDTQGREASTLELQITQLRGSWPGAFTAGN